MTGKIFQSDYLGNGHGSEKTFSVLKYCLYGIGYAHREVRGGSEKKPKGIGCHGNQYATVAT